MEKSVIKQYASEIYATDFIVASLKKCKIFSILTKEELINISQLFTKLEFEKGEYIFFEGDPSDWLYIVTRDRVKTIKHTRSGRVIIMEINSRGDMFDCATVLNNKSHAASAQAKGAVAVIRISRKNFLEILDQYPLLKTKIANYINNKLTDAYERLESISTETVNKRIILLLFKHSDKTSLGNSGYRKIDFSLTRQEIAEMAGTTVETCCRIMSEYQKQGIVKSLGKKIFFKAKPFDDFLLSLT